MSRTTSKTSTTTTAPAVSPEVAAIIAEVTAAVTAALAGTVTSSPEVVETARQKAARIKREQKAATEKAAAAEARKAEFFGGIAANREQNAEMAEALRAIGLVPNGRVWKAFKAGEKDTTVLAELGALDKVDRDAASAAKKAAKKA